MKVLTKKNIACSILIFTSVFSFGQIDNRFYKNVDDYKNNKPDDIYEIKPGSCNVNCIWVSSDDGFKKTKYSKLPFDLLKCDGILYRIQNGKSHTVQAEGTICFYTMHIDQYYDQWYYSYGLTGEILKWDGKLFLKNLEKYGLLEEYNSEKSVSQFKDSYNDVQEKLIRLHAKYVNLLNEKMK